MATSPYITIKRASPSTSHTPSPLSLRTLPTKRLSISIILLISLALYFLTPHLRLGIITNTGLVLEPKTWDATRAPSEIRIAKATILYDEYSNDILVRALARHEKEGYEVRVLRKQIVNGYADQYLWLHEIIVKELRKKSDVRAEWIVWFDLQSVLPSNPNPLHAFLPPLPSTSPDPESFRTLSIIATKYPAETHALNPNLLFLRVNGLTLRILTLALAAPYTEPDRDWGVDVAGATLQYVLEEERYGMRGEVVWVPGEWFNSSASVFVQPWAPSPVLQLLKGKNILEQKYAENEGYPSKTEVDSFWALVTEAKRVLNEARNRGNTEGEGEFQEEVRVLKYAVEARTWDVVGLREAVERLKEGLGIGEVVGFEPVYG